jgi:hypothetical protein
MAMSAAPASHNRNTGTWVGSGSIVVVDSSNLKPWQAKAIFWALRPGLGYLYRLRTRMEKRGFLPTDKLYGLTVAAYDALHRLCGELHYISCGDTAFRRPPT